MQDTPIGQRFARWIVLGEAPKKSGNPYWLCQCDCGTIRPVAIHHLRHNRTNSCGCYQKERMSALGKKHGKSRGNREYRIWCAAITRCTNPKQSGWENYGGRGITMCDRWRHSFEAFLEDMGPCPEGHSLERKDVNGPYGPENCIWATSKEQARNNRSNVLIEYQGKTYVMSELAEHLGIDMPRFKQFYRRQGLPLEEAIARATGEPKRAKTYLYKGEYYTLRDLAPLLGVQLQRLVRYVQLRPLPLEQAIAKCRELEAKL